MPDPYDYATIRVVPRIERGEFVNVGVLLACPTRDFLGCRLAGDLGRVEALYPGIDRAAVSQHLQALEDVCRARTDGGPIAQLSARERFHWLTHPRSTIVQTSEIHAGRTEDPQSTLDWLYARLVTG